MFEANNHSNPHIGWKEVSDQSTREVIRVLREGYGITGVMTAVHQVDEWEQASNNYRVFCDRGYLLVRRHIICGEEQIRTQTTIIRHLRDRVIPTPLVRIASNGRKWVESGGHWWQVFEYIPGNHFSGEEYQLRETAMLTAEVREALAYVPFRKWGARNIVELIGPLHAAYWNAVRSLEGENTLELLLLEHCSYIQECIERTVDVLEKTEQRDELIDGDFHPHNFIFPPASRCMIIDFGNACIADGRYDISMAIHRLVRQYVVYMGRPWHETLSRGIEVFLEAYGGIDPEVARSIKFLPAFMRAMLLRKLAHNFSLYRRGARTPESCLGQCQKFFGLLAEIEAIEKILV